MLDKHKMKKYNVLNKQIQSERSKQICQKKKEKKLMKW
nr:MAG TPA: hypothetical protein [Caudoviricetes sp.]